MTIFAHYNAPLDQQSATIGLGMPNVEDSNFMFRVGVIKKAIPNEVRWVLPEWMSMEQAVTTKIIVTREDTVLFDKKKVGDEKFARNKMDIGSAWPVGATGATSTTVNYLFAETA